MEEYAVIVLTCRGGHTSRIALAGYDYDGAVELAKILDGTADVYVENVRDDNHSLLAHCPTCGALFNAVVELPQ